MSDTQTDTQHPTQTHEANQRLRAIYLSNKYGDLLDAFNKLPDNAIQFAFVLEPKDALGFFEALEKIQQDTTCQLLQECKERIEKKRDEVEDGNGYGIGHRARINKALSIISDIQKEHGL